MNVSNIAGMATDLWMSNVQTEASARVLDMVGETMEDSGAELVKMMGEINGVGRNIDVTA